MPEALRLYQQALQSDPQHAQALYLMGTALLQSGQAVQALPLLDQAVRVRPGFADAHAALGAALRRSGRSADALASFENAVRLNRKHIEAQVGFATALYELGRLEDALRRFDTALALAPQHASAHCNRGAVLQLLQRPADALDAFDRALAIAPQMAEAHANRANALRALGRYTDALAACDKALTLRPGYPAAFIFRGFALLDIGRAQDALASFEAALRTNSADVRALNGRGQSLAVLGQPDQALACYDAALARFDGDAHTHFHKALALSELQRFEEALASVDRVLALDPNIQGAHHGRANILTKLGRHAEALREYKAEYALHPSSDYALGHYLSAKLGLADWHEYGELVQILSQRVSNGESPATPFVVSLVSDSGDLLRRSAETHATYHKAVAAIAAPLIGGGDRQRIRIGYFSSDFTDHPVAHLLTGVLAAHDRQRFEVFAYAFGDRRDAYTEAVRDAVDHFVDCKGLSTQQIVHAARLDGLDVAIDLNGYTSGGQTAVFASRVAPVQLSYIGFLGTMGAAFIDYLVVDPVIAPASHRRFFTEKLLTLPWYQCNSSAEKLPAVEPVREQYGLPNDAFVFVSFNNVFKLTPQMFALWMRILKRTPESVLWVLASDPAAQENLLRAAAGHGIAASRVVFAKGAPRAEHLARQRLADLMLDTFPYNGGATTSNALRAGLPVLTLAGEGFASRMGASLLTAAGAPDLIADSWESYEDKAVRLALDADAALAVRRRIGDAHTTSLFDPLAFARRFERGLALAVERSRAGLAPDDIDASA